MFLCRKDAAVITALDGIIGNMLHDHRSFLFFDQTNCLCNEFFRVVLIHGKGSRLYTLQNAGCCAAGQCCALCNITDQVICYLAGMRIFQYSRLTFCVIKATALTHHVCIQNVFLSGIGDGILQTTDIQLTVDVCNRLLDQLFRIKIHRIGVFVIDGLPELLELCFFKPVVQRIFQHFRLVAILEHGFQHIFIINRLNQRMHTLFDRFQCLRHRRKRSGLHIVPVVLCDVILLIHIVVADKILIDSPCLTVIHFDCFTIKLDGLSNKVVNVCLAGAVIQHGFGLLLQSVHKSCVALAGNNGQDIDILHLISQHFHIHAVSVLIHAQTQATAYFLPLLGGTVTVLQGTDLEHIRVIPAFPQGRVGEDEPGRLFKGQQTFLIFQDQVIGRNVIRHI